MDFVYLLVDLGSDWEDMSIFLTEDEAIETSIKRPKIRVEIFSKNGDFGYLPTYNYYKNGILCKLK